MFLLVNKLYFSPAPSPKPFGVSQPSSRTSFLYGAVLGGCLGGAQLQQPHPPGGLDAAVLGAEQRGLGKNGLKSTKSVPTLPCCIPSAWGFTVVPKQTQRFLGFFFFALILFSTGTPRGLWGRGGGAPSPLPSLPAGAGVLLHLGGAEAELADGAGHPGRMLQFGVGIGVGVLLAAAGGVRGQQRQAETSWGKTE